MRLLRRMLAVVLLAPMLAVLIVAAANPRPSLSLRLLTWRSAPLPIGAWLGLGVAGGLALGGGASALAFTAARQGARRLAPRREQEAPGNPVGFAPPREVAMPGRRAGDPAPTVTVPFRVVQRPPGRQVVTVEDDDWGRGASDNW
jgi:hypothetical protein